MTEQLHRRLSPVRARQRMQQVLHRAMAGLLAGSCLAMAVGLVRLAGPAIPWPTVLAIPLVGFGLGALWGTVVRSSWHTAASAVDACYELKDRAATALCFAERPGEIDALHRLQIADAIDHLVHIEPRRVAPLRIPRTLPYALVVCAATMALLVVPRQARSGPEPVATSDVILEQAALLEESMIEPLERLAEEQRDPELEMLVDELKELVAELKEPGMDQREALARLSEMQAAIAEAQAEFDLEAIEARLASLGKALSPAAVMQGAAAALDEGDYAEAADQLEQADPAAITPREGEAVAANLKDLAGDSGNGRTPGEISDAAMELAEALEKGDPAECQSGLCKLAGICEKQALRAQIGAALAAQLAQLAECKVACNKNGGTTVARTQDPSKNWGTGASGQPTGDDPTSIDAQRRRETIAGIHGEGPSEKETTNSPEGEPQHGTREYREKYEEYRKMTEAVLDSEPLPLGHRQTIRKYFESIRPQNSDGGE